MREILSGEHNYVAHEDVTGEHFEQDLSLAAMSLFEKEAGSMANSQETELELELEEELEGLGEFEHHEHSHL